MFPLTLYQSFLLVKLVAHLAEVLLLLLAIIFNPLL
jgi:hypothetical protein